MANPPNEKNLAEKEMAKKQVARITDYKKVFESESGKRVLYDLMGTHFFLRTSFVKNDPYETALREGERNVVIRILQRLNMDSARLKEFIERADKNG